MCKGWLVEMDPFGWQGIWNVLCGLDRGCGHSRVAKDNLFFSEREGGILSHVQSDGL
jgi:hypothetical protein